MYCNIRFMAGTAGGESNIDPQPRDEMDTDTVWLEDWLLCLDFFFFFFICSADLTGVP